MSTRRRAREIVLQVLYEDDIHPERDTTTSDQFMFRRLHGNRALVRFSRDLLEGVLKNRWELDKELSSKAANWSLRRMAAIDRNILRMAAYEITIGATPGRVAINEAIELAKRYGSKQSFQFVNGILDRVLAKAENRDEPAEASPAEPDSPSPAEPNEPTAETKNTAIPKEQDSTVSSA